MRGDATLFTRDDEVEAQWEIIDPVLSAWEALDQPVEDYEAGSQGPDAATGLLQPGCDDWRAI
jgi:glucose-6-phosphate 1-dehydrogenase